MDAVRCRKFFSGLVAMSDIFQITSGSIASTRTSLATGQLCSRIVQGNCNGAGGPPDSPPPLLCKGNAATILGRTMFSIQQQKKYILH